MQYIGDNLGQFGIGAQVRVGNEVFIVEKKEGHAPHDVAYFGRKVSEVVGPFRRWVRDPYWMGGGYWVAK